MTDRQILSEIKKYFIVQELVGRRTYEKYGLGSWKFLDFRLLWALLIVRTNLNKRIFINNWHKGGRYSQRGLRSNVQQISSLILYENICSLSCELPRNQTKGYKIPIYKSKTANPVKCQPIEDSR